jgi:hypothetical protein
MSVCASIPSSNSRVTYRQLLLRLIDDYLFITTDQAKARKFLDIMIKGLETPFLSYILLHLTVRRTPRIWLFHLPRKNLDEF